MREPRYSILADIQDAIEQAKQGKLTLYWQRTIQREYRCMKVTPAEQQSYEQLQSILSEVPQWSGEEDLRHNMENIGGRLWFCHFWIDHDSMVQLTEDRNGRFHTAYVLDGNTSPEMRREAALLEQKELAGTAYRKTPALIFTGDFSDIRFHLCRTLVFCSFPILRWTDAVLFFEHPAKVKLVIVPHDLSDLTDTVIGIFQQALCVDHPQGEKVLCRTYLHVLFEITNEPVRTDMQRFGILRHADFRIVVFVKIRDRHLNFFGDRHGIIFAVLLLAADKQQNVVEQRSDVIFIPVFALLKFPNNFSE